MHGIAIPHTVISSAARNLFRPLFPTTPSLSRLQETPSAFPRYGVSRFSPSDALRLTANEKDPSTPLGMTIRETRLFHFPRYGVSRFSPSDALRLTANEKDPSTSLPMTIRETRLFRLSATRCFRFLLSDMHHKQKSHERLCSWLFHLHASWDYP